MNRTSERWLRCLGGLLIAFALSVIDTTDVMMGAALSGAALVVAALSIGIARPTLLVLLAAIGAGIDLLLSHHVAVAVEGGAILLLTAFFVVIWLNNPFSPVVAKPGVAYSVNGAVRRIPALEIVGRPPHLLHPPLLDRLDRLAAYADALLTRHQIRYVAQYGTVLGAVRHNGLIPWDDDIDFRIFDEADAARMRERFDAIAAEARRDGYVLFRHGTYWKLAIDNFWRYPAVDLFDPDVTQQAGEVSRVPFEQGMLNLPENAAGWVRKRYGEKALTQVVHDLPFWDSGFVPAFVDRLFGYRMKSMAADLYSKLFFVTSK